MQASLETLVGNLREQSLLTGSTLVGKRVAMAGGFGQGGSADRRNVGQSAEGADMLTMSVYNKEGELVFRQNVRLEPDDVASLGQGRTLMATRCPSIHTRLP